MLNIYHCAGRQFRIIKLLLAFPFLFTSFFLSAQNESGFLVKFKSGIQLLPENLIEFTENPSIQQEEIFDGYFYRYVQFYDIPLLEQKKEMEAAGLRFLEYIPHKVYPRSYSHFV